MEARALDSHFLQLAELEVSSGRDSYNAGPLSNDEIRQNKLRVENGLAVIPVYGVLMKQVPLIYRWFGIKATAYSEIVEMINEALGRDDVDTIMLDVDSPGGQVAGGIETANAIYAARSKKKVIAYAGDMACSGAYWLASQAEEFTAGPNAMIGSIGVYCVYVDYSKEAESLGIKVYVISSGEHKGMGVAGAKITEAQIAAMKEVIDGMNNNFVTAVVRGRGLSQEKVRELATGRVWIAAAAKAHELIDGVVNQLESAGGSGINENQETNLGDNVMENVKELTAASLKAEHGDIYSEILEEGKNAGKAESKERFARVVELCDGDNDLAVESFAAGRTDFEVLQAKHTKLKAQLKTAKEETAAAKAAKAKPQSDDTAAENEFSDSALLEVQSSDDGTPEEAELKKQFNSQENTELRVRLVAQEDGDSEAAFKSWQKLLAAEAGGTVSYAGRDDKK